jgi:hypothetical protein
VKLTVQIESFKPLRSNTLFGFADVVVPELRLRIHELTVHESHGKRWVGLPGKPMINRDGEVLRNDRGKPAYTPVIEFTERTTRDAFSARVIEALLALYPNAFSDKAAP